MNIIDYLYNNMCPLRHVEETPIAFTAAALSLSTHIHPIEALHIIFSDEELLNSASNYDTAIDTVQDIISFYNLRTFCTIGDLSDDFRLIGHLESLTSSLMTFLHETNLTLEEMNMVFDEHQIWEKMSCSGKSWVSSGNEWTVIHLKKMCGLYINK